MQVSALLLRWGSYCRARNVRVLIVYLFFIPVMLSSVLPRLSRFSSEKVSWCLETSLLSRLPSRDGTLSLPLLSLFFVFYIFSYLLSKTWVAFLGA